MLCRGADEGLHADGVHLDREGGGLVGAAVRDGELAVVGRLGALSACLSACEEVGKTALVLFNLAGNTSDPELALGELLSRWVGSGVVDGDDSRVDLVVRNVGLVQRGGHDGVGLL